MSIRRADPVDVGAVTACLAEAFLHGDYAAWLIPDLATRRAVYGDYFRIFAEHFLEHGIVDATTEFEGVALWAKIESRADLEIADYDERLAKAVGPALGRFVTLDMAMHEHHPVRPHYYLSHIAVHPDCQRQGHGAQLLDYRLRRIQIEGFSAYLEATGTENERLYCRHGFEPRTPVPIPGGPWLFPMWRKGLT